MSKKIVGVSLGSCVHVAGVYRFLQLTERFGYCLLFLGPAVSVQELIGVIKKKSLFFLEKMRKKENGAGGALFRDPRDLEAIYRASRRGNFLLLCCYSGTVDLVRRAKLLKETINIAWVRCRFFGTMSLMDIVIARLVGLSGRIRKL
ncbi:MAG: hypothetical protein N2Z84_04700 [Atribacterota bacterium]|nr:hypothetical protein [Atribacterota bacterium]